MRFTTLKKTDMSITVIGIGTNKVGGHNYYKDLSETEGKNFVKEAIALGVNFIDTADVYGHGRSEELIGEVLREIDARREELIIATKGGNEWDDNGNVRKNNRPEYLRRALEASLKRLGTDYVDLYYLHFPDGETPIAESVGELSRLKEEGKIRAIGVSNLNLDQLKEADRTCPISALQSGYNLFDRRVEADLLPYCAANDISFIPYFPLASGLLSGKYKKTDPAPKRWSQDEFEKKIAATEKLKEIAEAKGTNLPNLALAWLLAQNGVDAVIPGGRRPEHIQGTVKAADVKLTPEDLSAIRAVVEDPSVQ
jgi:aryl-alcohol dehydrogenase-like predicted oxidoreductase